jgi:hypothetical protein
MTTTQAGRRDAPARLMPSQPQLKTITLGGAVSGLGIESLVVPHRTAARVRGEMEIPHWGRAVVLARPDNEHADLFEGPSPTRGTARSGTRCASRSS